MNVPGACYVASARSKGLGKGAHHDVHISRRHTKVFTHPTAALAHGPYAVSLIQEQVCLHSRQKKLVWLKENISEGAQSVHVIWVCIAFFFNLH